MHGTGTISNEKKWKRSRKVSPDLLLFVEGGDKLSSQSDHPLVVRCQNLLAALRMERPQLRIIRLSQSTIIQRRL